MADKVGSIYVDIGANLKDFEAKMKTATSKLNDFGKRANEIGRDLSLKVTAPIIGIGTAAVMTAGKFEKLRTSLNVLTGSADAGAAAFERLQEFSAGTPFQLEELVRANNTLMGFGLSADEAYNSLQNIGDIAAIAGGDLGNISLAFGQVAASGRLMGQDLLQLINNGVPIIQMLADSMGVAESEIKELVSAGQVTFPVLVKAFQDATAEGGKFANGMQIQSQTIFGVFSTLKDNVSLALGELGKTIVETFNLNEVIQNLTKRIQDLVSWFQQLTPEGQRMILIVTGLFGAVGPLLVGIGSLSIALSGLGTALTFLTGPIGIAIAAIGALAAATIYLYDNWEAVTERFKDVNWWRNTLIDMLQFAIEYNPFGMLIKAYNALARALGGATIPDVFAGMRETLEGLKVETKEYEHEFGSFGEAVKNATNAALGAMGMLNDEVNKLDGKQANVQVNVNIDETRTVNTESSTDDNIDSPALKTQSLSLDTSAFEQGSSTMLDLLNPVNQKIVALGNQFDILNEKQKVFGLSSEELANNQLQLVTQELNKMIESGQTSGEYFEFLKNKMKELKNEASTMPTVFENLKEVFESMQGQMVNGFMSIGQAFGKSAEDGKKATSQIIKQLISQATAQLITKIMASLPFPANIVAAGGAGFLIGSLISKIPAFAEGGAVTGPTLAMIGEKPGSRGEAIIPFEKIPKIFSEMGGMGNKMMVEVRGVLDGDVIRLVQDRAVMDNALVR